MDEITLEITDFCENNCKYCSSNATDSIENSTFMDVKTVIEILDGEYYDYIIISGGEPLSHPKFYEIFRICEKHANDVVVYSNLIKHIAYNAGVIDGIYVEAKITLLSSVQKLGILKRVEQGREKSRPEVTFSRNYDNLDCNICKNIIVKPDGTLRKSPCKKEVRLSSEAKVDFS